MSEDEELEASILGQISAGEEKLVRAAQDLENIGKQNKKLGLTKRTRKRLAAKQQTGADAKKSKSDAKSAAKEALAVKEAKEAPAAKEVKDNEGVEQAGPSAKEKPNVLPIEEEEAISPTKLPTVFSNDSGKVLCVGTEYDDTEKGSDISPEGGKQEDGGTIPAASAVVQDVKVPASGADISGDGKSEKPKAKKTKKSKGKKSHVTKEDTILGFELDDIPDEDDDAEILDAAVNPEYESYEIPDYSYRLHRSGDRKPHKSSAKKDKALSPRVAETAQPRSGSKKHVLSLEDRLGREVTVRRNTFISKFFQFILMICIPVIILWLSFRLVASSFFAALEFLRLGPVSGLDSGTRQRFADYALGYLFSNADRSYLKDLTLGDKPAFTGEEISHMTDVKDLVATLTYMLFLAVALAAVSIIVLSVSDRRALTNDRLGGAIGRAFFCGAVITLSLVAVAVPLMLLDWQIFFTGFHHYLFPQGNWQFDPDSLLIRLFPEQFWYDAAVVLVALAVFTSLAIALSNWPRRRKPLEKIVAKT